MYWMHTAHKTGLQTVTVCDREDCLDTVFQVAKFNMLKSRSRAHETNQ